MHFDRLTLMAIAMGGVLGASLRSVINRPGNPALSDGGWFEYAPNTSVTVGTDVTNFQPVGSAESLETAAGIPIDTLFVNTFGCLLLGLFTMLLTRPTAPTSRRLLVGAATGFCGSLTTFSTFAVELAVLLRGRPVLPAQLGGLNVRSDGSVAVAVVYLLLSLIAGAAAFWLGRLIAQSSNAIQKVDTPGVSTFGGTT